MNFAERSSGVSRLEQNTAFGGARSQEARVKEAKPDKNRL
jgi:hypothetical protein